MDDETWIAWVILWIGINAIIGYAIGKPKNAISDCVVACIILGPIGWLIALAIKGQVRECPFCAEQIKTDAKVCRYCGRDLPPENVGAASAPRTSVKSQPSNPPDPRFYK
jgi:hypothetical protein